MIPLPLDGTPLLPLLNGCWILADAPIMLSGFTAGPPSGIPLPIPVGTGMNLGIYTQVLGFDASTLATTMSSGFATSIGL